MKIKVGDTVVPKARLGKVVSIKEGEVIISWKDEIADKWRESYLTQEQADRRGKDFDTHVDEALVIIYEHD